MRIFWGVFAVLAVLGISSFLGANRVITVPTPASRVPGAARGAASFDSSRFHFGEAGLTPPPEATGSSALPAPPEAARAGITSDLPNQEPLPDPPLVVKAVYVTAWSAGSKTKMNSLMDLIKNTELNAVVLDIKDYSGHISYKTDIPEVNAAHADAETRIWRPNVLLKELHNQGIYVIGRVTVFQDPLLAKAHPEWALYNETTGEVWTDKKGLAWMDPSAEAVWSYNLAIAKDALARGFDEINFDYVRFASDGDLSQIDYPYWDGKTPKHVVISNFFKYLRDNMPEAKLSVDLFGLSTIDTWDDLGIGQVIEDAYKYFDYVCPMVYPSHYAPGFLGYKNPAAYPYEVINYSLNHALERFLTEPATAASTTATSVVAREPQPIYRAKLRPWLQDFDLGSTYNAPLVREEIKAVYDALLNGSSSDKFAGWLLWDPANIYTAGALEPAP